MSIVQERIQENERQLTLDRQSLAHMEYSHCALGGVNDQGPSLFVRTIRRLNAGIDKLEEANIILRHLHHDAESTCRRETPAGRTRG